MESFESLRSSLETVTKGLGHLYNAEEAKSIGKILLTELIGEDWFSLTQKLNHPLSDELKSNIERAYQRLLAYEPIQYILGKAHFYGRDFFVSQNTLIPRGETEELMVSIRDKVVQLNTDHPPYTWQILDIGTGTGCIPISLQLELSSLNISSHIKGVDVSEKALKVARKNASLHNVETQFGQLDILKANKDDFKSLDIIVSNPPYIPLYERQEMNPNVTKYEPSLALFVPDDDPLIFYRKITHLATSWLRSGGILFFEIHEEMGDKILALFDEGYWINPILQKDINGKDRMLIAKKRD